MFNIDNAITNNENLFKLNEETGRAEFKYKDDLQAEYNALYSNLFPNLNLDPSTPQGQIITAEIQSDLATISNIEAVLNAFFFGGSGTFLDLWAWNTFRVVRKAGVASTATVTITGVPSTEVPAGFTITDGTQNYTIVTPVTIGALGSVDAIFQATEISTHVASAGSITDFVTIVDGVETVTNADAATAAILRESDDSLLGRCYTFGATATNSSFRSILANVGQVSGVSKIAGAENYTGAPKVFGGVELPDHSIAIVVQGGEDADIAAVIQNSRATGCDMLGNTTVTVMDAGVEYVYSFFRPVSVPLKMRVEVIVNTATPTNYETVIKENLTAFVGDLAINTVITQPSIAKWLYRNINGLEISDVTFSKVGDALGYAPVSLSLIDIASITSLDIEVVAV